MTSCPLNDPLPTQSVLHIPLHSVIACPHPTSYMTSFYECTLSAVEIKKFHKINLIFFLGTAELQHLVVKVTYLRFWVAPLTN